MGLARTPPQVVYPRSAFITPTPQGAGANPRQPLSLSGAPRALPPPVNPLTEPVTPVRVDNAPSAIRRTSSSKLEHQPASSQSTSGDLSFTPLSARVTPVAAARPIITPSENGPLNAHINSLNKQLAELEAQKKDLNARVTESERKLGEEIAWRERKIEELYDQHEREKWEWKELFDAAQAVHNIAHQQAKYELEQERLAAVNLESRLLQQNVRILVRDHSLTKFQVHEAQQGKESFVYQDQLHVTKQDLEDAQKLIEKIQQQRDKDRAEYKENFKALKSQLDQERKIRSSAENGRGTLEGANAELAADLDRAKKDLAAAQARVKELQEGATEAKSTQKALEKSRTKYESEIEKLNRTIESLESDQETAKEKIAELEKQNRSLEKERDKRAKAEVETKALQKQVSELEAGNAKESRKEVKDLEAKLARAQTQAKEAQDALKTTEARVNMLEKKLASSKDAPAPVVPVAPKSAPTKDKGKQKEKIRESPAVDLSPNSKSSDQVVEELVFTDLSDDDGDDDVQLIPPSPKPVQSQPKSQSKSQPKAQLKSTASSSSNPPPAVAPERPKARPKMRPPPKSPSPPLRSQRPEPQVIDDDNDDVVVVQPAPVKSKPRPKMRPAPEPSPPPAPKPVPQPKGSAKGKQNPVVDSDVDELESPPPTKAKARAAPTKEKAPAKEKEKEKGKPKEKEKEKEKVASTSKPKRPIDDEPEVGDAVVAKKKKRKLIPTDAPDLDWGAGSNWLDPLGIPTTLSPIRDKEKVPRHRPGRI